MPILEDEGQTSPTLVGAPGNRPRDPSATVQGRKKGGKGTVGDQALMDSIILIGISWVLLLLLFYSVRGHNV